MSNRTILSRPRTRVYDCNYNIGQSYYKPMVDHLDRKYSGRGSTELPPAYPAMRQQPEEEKELLRTRRLAPGLDLADEEAQALNAAPGEARRKMGSALREFDDIFDNRPTARGPRASSLSNGAANGFDDDVLDEVSASMKRLRASRAARAAEEMEDEMDAIVSRRKIKITQKQERETSLADRALDAVGIRKVIGSDADEDSVFKKRTLRITASADAERNGDLTKWTKVNAGSPLALESANEAAAIQRARQTRSRLQDLEAEMDDLAERSAKREKRAAQLRSLVAENAERAFNDEEVSSVRVKSSVRSEKKTVTF